MKTRVKVYPAQAEYLPVDSVITEPFRPTIANGVPPEPKEPTNQENGADK